LWFLFCRFVRKFLEYIPTKKKGTIDLGEGVRFIDEKYFDEGLK